jgi:CRISPR-associated endonuclease/helicase Cas3
MALYLGARLLVKQLDKRNEPAETALLKLARVLSADAGVGDEIEQAAIELAQRPIKQGYRDIFREVVRGYIYRRRVRIHYKPLGKQQAFDTSFATYLLEPSPIGFSTYLIGHSQIVDALRAYKLERIQEAHLTNEAYEIPKDFPGLEYLRNAWSIITGEETQEIVLRFSPRVRERVLETVWHPSQSVEEDPENVGWLLWRAHVADTLDMLPWIRGWGSDVEVLQPAALRQTLRREAARLEKLYLSKMEQHIPTHFYLWAKFDARSGLLHPLIYHSLDVGQNALALLRNALPPATRQELSDALQLDEETTDRLLAFFAALHDIGKASPAFQAHQSLPAEARQMLLDPLQAAGVTFRTRGGERRARHEIITAHVLKPLLHAELGLDKWDTSRFAQAISGHHGIWPPPGSDPKGDDLGDATWDALRKQLFETLQAIFQPPQHVKLPKDDLVANRLLTIFSGLLSVADWIGSDENRFPYQDIYMPWEEYLQQSAENAYQALKALGWLAWQPAGELVSFAEMFPDFDAPNAIQSHTIQALEAVQTPALMILEAQTGSGKTEAAFFVADRWLQTARGGGLYVAMPTQATSNQMFGRTLDFLETRYPRQWLNVHLVHGSAILSEEMEKLKVQSIAQDDDEAAHVVALTWFLPRKRTLLAPFGVGTVDQTLLSVLQTKHFFVRLFGLSHKVVIFDEVHAYDTYMETLFQRLLTWLGALGASVIILSATLPDATRRNLVQAYLGKSQHLDRLPPADYPRLTLASQSGVESIPLPAGEDRQITFEWTNADPQAIAEFLHHKLQDGGCAAVICNRVARAQEVYQAIKQTNIVPQEDLILFHARFPFAWRKEIEQRVLHRFGKEGERPHKSIVVSTQVIEQSLDLDFDLMLTDLAPIDLLIQRAGRLHRHSKRDAGRPEQLKSPRLVIACPAMQDGRPDFGRDIYVYEKYILLRTWLALQARTQLALPSQTSALIESVYQESLDTSSVDADFAPLLQATWDEMHKKRSKDEFEARSRLVPSPSHEDLLESLNIGLDEDNPEVHQTLRALTRLALPRVPLVCLHRTPQGLAWEPNGSGAPLDPDAKPAPSVVRELVRHAVSVSDRRVLAYFQNQEPPRGWKKVAALRYHHVAVFENGRCPLGESGLTLILDRETGLRVAQAGTRSEE